MTTTALINTETKKPLIFPEFDDIKVSTKTFIIMTNLVIDLPKLFDFLPVTDYTFVPKKRGRKKKISVDNPNKDVPQGSIVTLKYENKIRGIDLKQKKIIETLEYKKKASTKESINFSLSISWSKTRHY